MAPARKSPERKLRVPDFIGFQSDPRGISQARRGTRSSRSGLLF